MLLEYWKNSADEKDADYTRLNTVTGRLAECATLAFLFLQLPQIILNTKNLMTGDFAALFAVPWMVSINAVFHSKREVFACDPGTPDTFTTANMLTCRIRGLICRGN